MVSFITCSWGTSSATQLKDPGLWELSKIMSLIFLVLWIKKVQKSVLHGAGNWELEELWILQFCIDFHNLASIFPLDCFLSLLNSVSDFFWALWLCFKKKILKKSVNKYINRNYFLRPTVKGKKKTSQVIENEVWGFLLSWGYSVIEMMNISKCGLHNSSSYWSVLKIYWQEGIFLFFVQEKMMSKIIYFSLRLSKRISKN